MFNALLSRALIIIIKKEKIYRVFLEPKTKQKKKKKIKIECLMWCARLVFSMVLRDAYIAAKSGYKYSARYGSSTSRK